MKKIKRMFLKFYSKFRYFFSGNKRIFDISIYKNKKIIIIGPAATSLNYMSGEKIDEFDYIVRINKSPLSLCGKEEYLGSRTDILYHCFNEDPIRGGGEINLKKLKDQLNKYIIYSYAEPSLEVHFRNMILKKRNHVFYRTETDEYFNLKSKYEAKIPSTGLQAINHIMNSDFKELHITGFTFFKSLYIDGYVTGCETNNKVKELAESGGNHNADSEEKLFKEIYHKNKHKRILLDDFLNAVLNKS